MEVVEITHELTPIQSPSCLRTPIHEYNHYHHHMSNQDTLRLSRLPISQTHLCIAAYPPLTEGKGTSLSSHFDHLSSNLVLQIPPTSYRVEIVKDFVCHSISDGDATTVFLSTPQSLHTDPFKSLLYPSSRFAIRFHQRKTHFSTTGFRLRYGKSALGTTRRGPDHDTIAIIYDSWIFEG